MYTLRISYRAANLSLVGLWLFRLVPQNLVHGTANRPFSTKGMAYHAVLIEGTSNALWDTAHRTAVNHCERSGRRGIRNKAHSGLNCLPMAPSELSAGA
jgi:hypothetical protein